MGRNFEESLCHAEAAMRLKARNPQYRLALVGLLHYSKHFSEARGALEPLLRSETSDGYAVAAESLQDMIEEAISRKRALEGLVNSSRPPEKEPPK